MLKVYSYLRFAVILGVIFAQQIYAQPQGFYLVDGEASSPFVDATGCYVVKVGKRAIINWDSFIVDENETIRFEMEDSESSVINFVSGGSESSIFGNLQSNGKIYLTHPSQVLVGREGT